MKKLSLSIVMMALLTASFTGCNENKKAENFEDRLENKSDDLEDRADDIEGRSDDFEDASDHIGEAADDIEDAMDSFRDALEEVDNPEDRAAIRKRINAILDSLEIE